MTTMFEAATGLLRESPKTWLVTGVAGFIGSSLLEYLLSRDQRVVGLDNFSTGYESNLQDVRSCTGEERWSRFRFIKGDTRDLETCREACGGVDLVLHQAALGSVPRSIKDPIVTNQSNIDGFLNMLVASRDAQVKRFVYAASSSTYGDHPGLPKREEAIGRPLSPYAVTKYVNELYAHAFALNYGMKCVGLRYFNVFGRRQDPQGAYAAVIPRWIAELSDGRIPVINGDGETSRDFSYIDNVIQANILAATAEKGDAVNQVYNVAVGQKTTLNELFEMIRDFLEKRGFDVGSVTPEYAPFRAGDIRHSLADVTKAKELLGYSPSHTVKEGMEKTVDWFAKRIHEKSREKSSWT